MSNIDPKEILGFDPDTRQRTDSVDASFKAKESTPPKELQLQFLKFAKSTLRGSLSGRGERNVNCLPDKLFCSTEDEHFIGRSYFSYPSARDGEFARGDERMHIQLSKAHNHLDILKYGEGISGSGKEDHVLLSFGEKGKKGFSVMTRVNGVTLHISYDDNGKVDAVYFSKGYLSINDKVPEGALLLTTLGKGSDLNDLESTGYLAFEQGKSKFDITLNDDKSVVSIKNSQDGEIKDDIDFPLRLNSEQIYDELIPQPLEKSFFDGPTDLDEKWKETDMMDLAGIKWQRH